MDIPLEVSFRNMDRSEAVESRVRERAAKLEKFFDRINSCRVVIEAPHRHRRKGKLYHVRIELGVPRSVELIVNRNPKNDHAHEDVYVAIRDAFDAAQRQLQDYKQRLEGAVKVHKAPSHGTVARLFAYEGYGFIAAADGQEVYFHRNAVVNDGFEKLDEGNEVRYVAIDGESANGPQATTVRPVGKHHIVD